jgi:hypothetical protein
MRSVYRESRRAPTITMTASSITWRFTTIAARTTLHHLYPTNQQHVD